MKNGRLPQGKDAMRNIEHRNFRRLPRCKLLRGDEM